VIESLCEDFDNNTLIMKKKTKKIFQRTKDQELRRKFDFEEEKGSEKLS
jgi:hypothetical protein